MEQALTGRDMGNTSESGDTLNRILGELKYIMVVAALIDSMGHDFEKNVEIVASDIKLFINQSMIIEAEFNGLSCGRVLKEITGIVIPVTAAIPDRSSKMKPYKPASIGRKHISDDKINEELQKHAGLHCYACYGSDSYKRLFKVSMQRSQSLRADVTPLVMFKEVFYAEDLKPHTPLIRIGVHDTTPIYINDKLFMCLISGVSTVLTEIDACNAAGDSSSTVFGNKGISTDVTFSYGNYKVTIHAVGTEPQEKGVRHGPGYIYIEPGVNAEDTKNKYINILKAWYSETKSKTESMDLEEIESVNAEIEKFNVAFNSNKDVIKYFDEPIPTSIPKQLKTLKSLNEAFEYNMFLYGIATTYSPSSEAAFAFAPIGAATSP